MQNTNSVEVFRQIAQGIQAADGLLITAGAGMGIDSGLPDFRGAQGFWRAFKPLQHLGKSFIDMANPDLFFTQPKLAWGFYGWRLHAYRETQPHAGFQLLKEWGQALKHGAFVFTSNVDGQFQKAGFTEQQVNECHGSIHYLQCCNNCCQDIWPATDFKPEVDEETCLLQNEVPRCPHCDEIARPNILMFGDYYWQARRSDIQEERMAQWLSQVNNLAVIELGAGTSVPTVRRFSEYVAQQANTLLVRINPDDNHIPQKVRGKHFSLAMGALEALEHIQAAMRENS